MLLMQQQELSGGGFNPHYQAVLDYATANSIPHPSTDVKILQNIVMQSLEDAGILNLLDVFHLCINDSGRAFSSINWADVNVAYANFGGTFLTNEGIISPSNSLGYNMLADSTNYQLGSCSWFYKLGVKGGSDISSGDYPLYCFDGSTSIFNTRGTLVRIKTNHTTDWYYYFSTQDPSEDYSFNIFTQNGSANRYYHNGSLIASATKAPDAIPNTNLVYYINSGGYSNVHELFGTSGFLDVTKVTAFNTIIEDYKTAIALL